MNGKESADISDEETERTKSFVWSMTSALTTWTVLSIGTVLLA